MLRLEQQSIFNVSNLLEKAKAARERREAAGISDSVEVRQDREAPPFDTRLVGKWLEVCPGHTRRTVGRSRSGPPAG